MRQPLGDYDERYDEFELVGEHRVEEEHDRPGRRLPTLLLFIVAMVVFAGGLCFAYFQGTRHAATTAASGDVPLIRADQTPDKVKPEQPGGMQIPDQNVSLYNERPGAAPVEKLLPPPEKPLPRPAPETRQAALPPPPAASTSAQGGTQPSAATPAAPQSTAPSAAPARPAAPPRPSAESKSAEQPKPTAPSAAAEAGRTGPTQIRLASVRTPEEARAEWARLKHDNADLLGNVTARAIRTDLGDKGIYYRVEAGPFENAAVASRMCGELKRRGLGCILAR